MTAPQTKEMVPVPAEQSGTVSPVRDASIQYFRGFEGAAVEPFPEAARKVLAEAVDPRDVEIKPDGIVFLPGVAWRRILTRAFGAGGWAILPRSPARVMGNIVVYHGALVALGRFVAEAVGECFYRENNPNMSYASCVEGAKTDALSRCCKDLGIATELWDANWREQWKAKYAVSYQTKDREGKPKTQWKLRDRVSNPHDLMAGAGGVEPARTAAASGESHTVAPTAQVGSSAAPAEAPASTPASTESDPSSDTGETATHEQLDAIAARLRELKWTKGMVRDWFRTHFGITTLEIVRILGALTEQQANTVFTLLSAFGTGAYESLLAAMKGRGLCR